MNNLLEMLEVIDENDNVVSLETRAKIHQNGLLHREIHVWFFTPKSEIIFQHRAKDKDTYPDKLDATVGGHVEPKMSYEETVIKECKEETGIDIDLNKLVFIKKIRKKSFDETTGLINNTIRSQYFYLYDGLINNLQIEDDESQGFVAWKINNLSHLSEIDKNKFIPFILEQNMLDIFNQAIKIFNLK